MGQILKRDHPSLHHVPHAPFTPEEDQRMNNGFQGVLDHIRSISNSEAEKGRLFERLMKAYLIKDRLYRERFSDVWLWSDWVA